MTNPNGGGASDERRQNRLLRLLIDEMLEQVREANRSAQEWTAEDRQKAEEQLDRIMLQVRGAATRQDIPS